MVFANYRDQNKKPINVIIYTRALQILRTNLTANKNPPTSTSSFKTQSKSIQFGTFFSQVFVILGQILHLSFISSVDSWGMPMMRVLHSEESKKKTFFFLLNTAVTTYVLCQVSNTTKRWKKIIKFIFLSRDRFFFLSWLSCLIGSYERKKKQKKNQRENCHTYWMSLLYVSVEIWQMRW